MDDAVCLSRANHMSSQRPRVGLLAAWGRLPIVVAQRLRRDGYRVTCLAVKDHADPVLRDICDSFHWIGAGSVGRSIRLFRREGVAEATMAGKFHKVLLYQPWKWWRHRPDWVCIKWFYPNLISNQRDRKDDTLLGMLTKAFAAGGIRFAPATDFAPDLLVGAGRVAGPPPSSAQQTDVGFGWDIAKQMGRLDIGQSVCVMRQAVLAVEAIEGTDACIRRAGELCQQGGFAVVKVAKPKQDMRFDVPTVGVRTLRTMVQARGRVLAIEADRTILLDESEFRDFADRHKITVLALPAASQSAHTPDRAAG